MSLVTRRDTNWNGESQISDQTVANFYANVNDVNTNISISVNEDTRERFVTNKEAVMTDFQAFVDKVVTDLSKE